MKKIFVAMVIVAALCSFAFGQVYTEGKHYMALSDMPEQENTVWEIYSVYCPFCERFDALINPELEKRLADNVSFELIYYPRYGQYGPASADVLAAAAVLGHDKFLKAKAFYFKEIIMDKGKNTNSVGIENFINIGLNAAGITREEYAKALATEEAKALLARWSAVSKAVVDQSGGIPSLVVKGKYLINMGALESNEMLIDLINTLLKK